MLEDSEIFVSPHLPPGVAYLVQRPKIDFDIPMITSVPEANSDRLFIRASMGFAMPVIDPLNFIMMSAIDCGPRPPVKLNAKQLRYAKIRDKAHNDMLRRIINKSHRNSWRLA